MAPLTMREEILNKICKWFAVGGAYNTYQFWNELSKSITEIINVCTIFDLEDMEFLDDMQTILFIVVARRDSL